MLAMEVKTTLSLLQSAWPHPEGLEMLKEARAMETAAEVSEEEDVEKFANGYLSAEDEVIEEQKAITSAEKPLIRKLSLFSKLEHACASR
uniref:Uncharacterized protein n=1 Tax=Ditylenchus dipsaci TaxID=166011 RepID=A0A915ERC4_9BILA